MEYEFFPVTRFEQNCSILWCESSRKAAVIDPGGDLWLITSFLELQELELERILITHGHGDHAGGAAELAELTGAVIEGPHRGDAHLINGLVEHGRALQLQTRSFEPQRWLEDGDRVRFGEVCLQVLHCPGHTRGHVAYFHEPSGTAFVGDILFRNAIGAWEHRNGDLATLVHSIRCKLFPLGDHVRFVPGHGPMSSFGQERQSNPFIGDGTRALELLEGGTDGSYP